MKGCAQNLDCDFMNRRKLKFKKRARAWTSIKWNLNYNLKNSWHSLCSVISLWTTAIDMAFFDLTKLFFTFSIFWLVVEPGDDRQSVRMRGVQCNASEKFIYRNYSCYAKSYSRNFSTTNIIATAKMPLNNLRVSFRERLFRSQENAYLKRNSSLLLWIVLKPSQNIFRPISDFFTNTEPFIGKCWITRTLTSALWLKKKPTTSCYGSYKHWPKITLLGWSIAALTMWVDASSSLH